MTTMNTPFCCRQLHDSQAKTYLGIVEHVAAACMARGVVRHAVHLGAHRSVLQVVTGAVLIAVVD
jgi:hypothetical protein